MAYTNVVSAWELEQLVLNILSACKAGKPGAAIAAANDDKAADSKTGSARCPEIDR